MKLEANPDAVRKLLRDHGLNDGLTSLIIFDGFAMTIGEGEWLVFTDKDFDLKMLEQWKEAGLLELNAVDGGDFEARLTKQAHIELMHAAAEVQNCEIADMSNYLTYLDDAFKD